MDLDQHCQGHHLNHELMLLPTCHMSQIYFEQKQFFICDRALVSLITANGKFKIRIAGGDCQTRALVMNFIGFHMAGNADMW
jgi:hypothetical protein